MASRQQMEWMLLGAMLADKERKTDAACEAFADPETRRLADAVMRNQTQVLEIQFSEAFAARESGELLIDALFRLLRGTAKNKRFLDAVNVFARNGALFLTKDQLQMLLNELHQWESQR